jgi:hypothetical protein
MSNGKIENFSIRGAFDRIIEPTKTSVPLTPAGIFLEPMNSHPTPLMTLYVGWFSSTSSSETVKNFMVVKLECDYYASSFRRQQVLLVFPAQR